MNRKHERPGGLAWWALVALITIAHLMGCATHGINRGRVTGVIPSREDIYDRAVAEAEPISEAAAAHFERLFLAASRQGRVCTDADSMLACRSRWTAQPVASLNRVVCSLACGDDSPFLVTCIERDVPTLSPGIGVTMTCQRAVNEALRASQVAARDMQTTATEAAEAARAETNTLVRVANNARRVAEEVNSATLARNVALEAQVAELTGVPVGGTPPAPTVRFAPPRTRRVASARSPRVAPALDHTLAGAGMACTAPVQAAHGTFTSVCEVRASNATSLDFTSRIARVADLTRTGTGAEDNIARISLPRVQRAAVATLLDDNSGGTRECASAVIFACRRTNWTHAHPRYFRQRLGVCSVANGNSTAVTLESFLTAAETPCGANPRVSIWGVTGGHVRLRFDREPDMTADGSNGGSADASDVLAPTDDNDASSLATFAPTQRPNAHGTEVMARAESTTRGNAPKVVGLPPTRDNTVWWWEHWWHTPPCALA